MKRVAILWVFLCAVFSVVACQSTTTVSTTSLTTSSITSTTTTTQTSTTQSTTTVPIRFQETFDFDILHDVILPRSQIAGEILFLEGLNLANGDYTILEDSLVIKKAFLATLPAGDHTFFVQTSEEHFLVALQILDRHQVYRIINGSFETGDLLGWTARTIFKQETQILSFIPTGVKPNTTMFSFAVPYGGVGNYVYGMDDRDGIEKDRWNERMGILQSSHFVLGGSGYIEFYLGGGRNPDLVYVSIRDDLTKQEIARYGNHLFHSSNYLADPQAYFEGNLVHYFADLRSHLGKKLYVELVDLGGRDWDLMTFDALETYLESAPTQGVEAINILPTFDQIYIPNQLINGSFAQGLQGFLVSNAAGWKSSVTPRNAFFVDQGILKSDLEGPEARGMVRTSLFRVDGSGIISMELAYGNGPRFDKDTFISIRKFSTNEEVFRFANRNASGGTFRMYYIDLSAYLNEVFYLEIVDNGMTTNDRLWVRNIITVYPTTPVYDFSQVAVNLIQ